MATRHLFVMDPIERINIKKDTTFAIMLETQRRGIEVWYTTVDRMGAIGADAFAIAAPVTVQSVVGDHAAVGGWRREPLAGFEAIWMRKDPPFTMDYIYATYLLELVDPAETLVLNRPAGLRDANEKAFIMHFPEVTPASLIAKSELMIRHFLDEHGKAVIKPLDQMGGRGIFTLRPDDSNLASLIDISTKGGTEFVMVQAFVPEAAQGDKRIILMDGEPLGAVLRVPPEGEFRGNLAVGGSAVATEISEADRKIIDAVTPVLRSAGLIFVGLDVLGDRLTEINVTSPTGVQEINRLNSDRIERRVLDWIVNATS